MDNNKNIEQIEAYLNNQLSEADKLAFEQRLKESEELSTEFERHQMAHKALDFIVAKSLKAQLESLEAASAEESDKDETKVIPMRSRGRRLLMLRTAAAALVIITIGLFYLYGPQEQMTGSKLVASYYEEPDFATRSNEDTQTVFDRGLSALENNDYAQAINLLDSVNVNDALYVQAQYFKGHALYLSDQYQTAETLFTTVGNSEDPRFEEDAEWYALLSCLAQDKRCSDKINSMIDNPNHAYHQQANSINQQLK